MKIKKNLYLTYILYNINKKYFSLNILGDKLIIYDVNIKRCICYRE